MSLLTKELAEVLVRIDSLRVLRKPMIVAIDGRSGSGKSTISQELAACSGGVYIDQDDFYVGGGFDHWTRFEPWDRWDRCIDWRRVRTELLVPLRNGVPASYTPFDWDSMAIAQGRPVQIAPAEVVILDGTYSSRPELQDLIDLSVLVTLPAEARKSRVKGRDGEDWSESWFDLWDAAEEVYFSRIRPEDHFDLVIRRESVTT